MCMDDFKISFYNGILLKMFLIGGNKCLVFK